MNPSYTVGQQIERLLRAVKVDEFYYGRLSRQLSGGEKERTFVD